MPVRFPSLLLVLSAILLLSHHALAQAASPCIPGIPCIVNFTGNDPFDEDPPAPNLPPAPNEPKIDAGERRSCDADFMNQIYARAFLEAERENMIAGAVIRKPDSILEYTCFDKHLSNVAHIAGPLFTESTVWQNRTIPTSLGAISPVPRTPLVPIPTVTVDVFMGDDRLDNSLELLVLESLGSYIDDNFAHEFLGGNAAGFNNDITGDIRPPGYFCDFMNVVYTLAKCNNFGIDDPFLTFSELADANLDLRLTPQVCNNLAFNSGHIALANNDNFQYVNFDKVDFIDEPNTGTKSYFDFVLPDQCQPPISTGLVKIDRQTDITIMSLIFGNTEITEEKTCINPGCSYDAEKDECVTDL